MLRRWFVLILISLYAVCTFAESKSQILADITSTMNDFIADVNFLCEDEENVKQKISSLTKAFGSDTYFIFNGKQMESMEVWMQQYYNECMHRQGTVHKLTIKQQTLEKVDPDNEDDKRYRFNAVLTREMKDAVPQPETVNFIIKWNGIGEYVTILESRGKWGIDIVGITKVSNKHWVLQLSELHIVILFILCVSFFRMDDDHRSKFSTWFNVTKYTLAILFLLAELVCVYLYIDYNDKEVIKTKLSKFDVIAQSDEHDVAWVKKDGQIGLIDYTGNLILDYQFDQIGNYQEGLSWVYINNRAGFVNGDGEIVIQPVYSYARTFKNGISLVGNENGYFVIDKKGKKLHDFEADYIGTFCEERALFRRNGKLGFISEWSYTDIVKPIYTKAQEFLNARAIVGQGRKEGVIDLVGKEVIRLEYDKVLRNGEVFMVKQGGRWGVMDADGKTLIPVKYDRIREIYDNGTALADLNGKAVIVKFNEKQDKKFGQNNTGWQ